MQLRGALQAGKPFRGEYKEQLLQAITLPEQHVKPEVKKLIACLHIL